MSLYGFCRVEAYPATGGLWGIEGRRDSSDLFDRPWHVEAGADLCLPLELVRAEGLKAGIVERLVERRT